MHLLRRTGSETKYGRVTFQTPFINCVALCHGETAATGRRFLRVLLDAEGRELDLTADDGWQKIDFDSGWLEVVGCRLRNA